MKDYGFHIATIIFIIICLIKLYSTHSELVKLQESVNIMLNSMQQFYIDEENSHNTWSDSINSSRPVEEIYKTK